MTKALRFCVASGCPARVPSGRCARHQREHEQQRGTPAERGYDAAWRRLRAAHLAEHPRCVSPGCPKAATDVDHIESIREAPHRRLDPTNLRSMCHSHHSARTRRDHANTTTTLRLHRVSIDWSNVG